MMTATALSQSEDDTTPEIERDDAHRTKTARDIMTRAVKTVSAEATLQETATLPVTNNISGAPVVDAEGKMVAIISESDLLSETKCRAALPHIAAFGLFLVPEETLQRVYHNGATLLAEEVMNEHVVSVEPGKSLQELTDLMLKHKINREDILRGLFGTETA